MPIMLVAHMDTVHKQQCSLDDIFVNMTGDTITSTNGIGGDDRCGIYMIMYILKNTDLRPYILFCEDEEIGGVGSNKFVDRYNRKNLKLNYIIQLDRANASDSVYYDLDNLDFEDYINKFGFKTAFGSFTDICHLCPALNCAGVNLSCGYYKQHTLSEYVIVPEMMATISKVINILENAKEEDYFEWREIKYVPTYNSDYNYASWYNDYFGYEKENKDNPYKASESNTYHCDYCSQPYYMWRLNETDDGMLICDECAKQYHLHKCKNCDVFTYGGEDLCKWCDFESEVKDIDNDK